MVMHDEDIERLIQALNLGALAPLRLRAELLLERIENPGDPVSATSDEREELARIASAPEEEDYEFLGHFDYVYENDTWGEMLPHPNVEVAKLTEAVREALLACREHAQRHLQAVRELERVRRQLADPTAVEPLPQDVERYALEAIALTSPEAVRAASKEELLQFLERVVRAAS